MVNRLPSGWWHCTSEIQTKHRVVVWKVANCREGVEGLAQVNRLLLSRISPRGGIIIARHKGIKPTCTSYVQQSELNNLRSISAGELLFVDVFPWSWSEMSGQSGSVVQNHRSIGVAVSSWCGGKKVHFSDGSCGYSWVHMHYMTYEYIWHILFASESKCVEYNHFVNKFWIYLYGGHGFNMYISFESFSLCCCPGPTDLFFERRSWRTKSLDNGQIIGLGILKTWGAMEGWAATSGKLWEANDSSWEKVVQSVWVLCFRMRERGRPWQESLEHWKMS